MAWIRSLNGETALTVTCADTAAFLSTCSTRGIRIHDVTIVDELTVKLMVRRQDKTGVQLAAEEKGGKVVEIRSVGSYFALRRLLGRPVLVMGLLIVLLAAVFLPTRIFFVRVEGNDTVSARLILEKAEACGIVFGSSRRSVRSEKMKNALLQSMPELQWAGINTYGCVAVISVEERETVIATQEGAAVSSIVACRDGVIASVTASKGNSVCAVGQAVKKGEVLISGYTDCGITIRATRAVGEVYAKTDRQLTVVTPENYAFRNTATRTVKKYGLIIGKKRINFYKGSGILPESCDRMYEENYVTLPGGFQLPVAIVTEVWTYYDCGDQPVDLRMEEDRLRSSARSYLSEQMIAGSILSSDISVQTQDGVFVLTGEYACLEMIGREQAEEIVTPYGKHD